MLVTVKAFASKKRIPFYERSTFIGDDGLTNTISMVEGILGDATGEYTETSEILKLKLSRIEITFTKENNGIKTSNRKR